MNPAVDSPALRRELAEVNERFEHAAPSDIIRWTLEQFGSWTVACSFEDLALVHLVRAQDADAEVIFLDTEAHFDETLEFVARTEEEWGLRLRRTTPVEGAEEWPCGTAQCCTFRKVRPLAAALDGRQAWLTSLKRVDSPSRAHASVVSWDETFGLVKVNPLVTWSDDDVAYYLSANDIPEHPLWARGYTSIGCAPVTLPPASAHDRRSGRWAGSGKMECGLHQA
ncbi:MAG: phosphoadenylyl-sulfate reductase [Acidimicrobiaceae bacterium]|nr:phosphoadenylyl-sulfate reductase [Acidimicrobiaceae bacterium]